MRNLMVVHGRVRLAAAPPGATGCRAEVEEPAVGEGALPHGVAHADLLLRGGIREVLPHPPGQGLGPVLGERAAFASARKLAAVLAAACGVTLILENHYKDDFWEYPEFAQKMDLFCSLVEAIDSPHFGVNYDPSNAFLADDDPLELLRRVSHRVVTMHASDRSLISGTLADLRREEEGAVGYASRLRHGEIGKGLNDYDAIFTELAGHGFCGWISIEDGVEGMEQLERSVAFLKLKIAEYWPTPSAS